MHVHVLHLETFRRRYARWLPSLDAETRRLGATLRTVGLRRVLVVARCPRHDQSTQWWYEQALLSVLAGAGIEVTFVTDGGFVYDLERLRSLGPEPIVVRADLRPSRGSFDAVVALPPSDVATQAALDLGVPLVACVTKKHEDGHPGLTVAPAPRTTLWHAFLGSKNFRPRGRRKLLGATSKQWRIRGAPFPMHRYYAPRTDALPSRRVLLFGTQDRNLQLAMAAVRAAGESSLAVLGAPPHREEVLRQGARHGVSVDWWAELAHQDLIDLIASCALVINPVTTESHYSLVLPITLGRPVVVTRSAGAVAFADPTGRGVQLLDARDVGAWARAIAALGEADEWKRACDDSARRAGTHHDAERFFASAVTGTFGGASGVFEPASAP